MLFEADMSVCLSPGIVDTEQPFEAVGGRTSGSGAAAGEPRPSDAV